MAVKSIKSALRRLSVTTGQRYTKPRLTKDEMIAILEDSRCEDGTFDLPKAICEGWALKAEKAQLERRTVITRIENNDSQIVRTWVKPVNGGQK